jgi:dephospho-CoA kinase
VILGEVTMLIVGLTGGIATGKSTVSNLLKDKHHFPIIDADILARKAVEPGTRAFSRILHTFGDDLALRDEAGKVIGLDRAALGKRVFSGDEVARKKLNAIVHPAVRWLMVKSVVWEWLVRGSKVVILDIPLLFESGLDMFCGISVMVATEPEIQLRRLLERDARLGEEDARGRITSQWPVQDKKKLADIVIENDSSKEDLERRVAEVVRERLGRSRLWTWLLRIPPFGLAFALAILLRRWYSRRRRTKTS